MAGKKFIDIPNLDELAARYTAGESIAQICNGTDIPSHTLRRRFLKMGIMRDNLTSIKHAYATGRMDNRRSRKGVPWSSDTREKMVIAMQKRDDARSRGYRVNSGGYVTYTRGKLMNVLVHRHVMEEHLGRKLLYNEVVHHIDFNKKNNKLENLQLMDSKDHARLHREHDLETGNLRSRNTKGQFEGNETCKQF